MNNKQREQFQRACLPLLEKYIFMHPDKNDFEIGFSPAVFKYFFREIIRRGHVARMYLDFPEGRRVEVRFVADGTLVGDQTSICHLTLIHIN